VAILVYGIVNLFMKELLTFIVALALGFGAGYYMALPSVVSDNGDDADDVGDLMMEEVAFAVLDIEADIDDETTPSVEIAVNKDSADGYNVRVITENHVFAPENVGGEHSLGEGHAHIYIDGKMSGRVYGEWYHLGALEIGEHDVRVRLTTNDHMELAIDEDLIEDRETIRVEAMMEEGPGGEEADQDAENENGGSDEGVTDDAGGDSDE
jgi:hypothetical protein